jgi:hypothetical protein
MDSYTQNTINLIGSAASPVTLTGSYIAGNSAILNLKKGDRVTLYVYYTMGTAESGNSIQAKLEYMVNNTDTVLVQESAETITSSTVTHTELEHSYTTTAAAGTYKAFPMRFEANDPYVKVSLKETGIAANGGSAYVIAIVNGR